MNDIAQGYQKALEIEHLTNDPADVALQQEKPPEASPVKSFVLEQGQRMKDIGIGAYANTLEGTANFWGVLAGAADVIAKYTGTEKGGIFNRLADSAEHWANHYHGKVRFKDFATNVTTGILGSGPGIAQFAMGPVWAGLEGFTEDGIKGAVTGVGRRWFAGKVFGVLHNDPSMASRMAKGSAFFAAEAAAGGERDPGKLAEAATIGAAFTAKGKDPDYFRPTEGQRVDSETFFSEMDKAVAEKKLEPGIADTTRRIVTKIVNEKPAKPAEVKPSSDLQPLQERGKYASLNINVTKLDGADIPAIEKMLNEIGETNFADLKTHQGGTVSHAQMVAEGKTQAEALARQTNTPVQAILKSWEADAATMYKRATAARAIHLKAAQELMGAAREAAKGIDATDRDLATYRIALGNFMDIHRAVTGITASHGRALSSFAARVSSDALGSERILNREIDSLLNTPGNDREMIKDMADKLVQLSEFDLPPDELLQKLDKAAQGFSRAHTGHMVFEGWIQALLSGPWTHARNTLGNALVATTQIPERWIASQIGRRHEGDKVAIGESGAMTYGMLSGIKDAFKLARLAYVKGETSGIAGEKIESPRYRAISAKNLEGSWVDKTTRFFTAGKLGIDETNWLGRGIDLMAEHVIRQPGKLLMAEDEFFKAIGYRMELHAQAHRMATAEKLNGKAFAERVREIVDNPPEDVRITSQDYARYVTFTNELGKTGRYMQAAMNSDLRLKFPVPFFRTPVNIFKYAFSRTPIAPLLMTSFHKEFSAGGARRDLALARAGFGTMVLGLAYGLVRGGLMTGGGPADPDERKIWRQENQPYSINIDGKFYQYNGLEPIGSLLGIGADVAEIHLNSDNINDIDDALVVGGALMGRQVTSKTFNRGIAELVHAVDDPVRYGEHYIERLAGTVVPTGAAQLNRSLNDPYFREADGVLDAIKARTPWSDNLMPRRGPWGEPIKTEGSLGPDWVSPIWTDTPKGEPINREMIEHHIEMPRLSRTIRINDQPIKLNAKQWDRYQELVGHAYKMESGRFEGLGLKEALNWLVQTSEYANMAGGPDGEKADTIRNIIIKYRQAVKNADPRRPMPLLSEFPELVTIAREMKVAQEMATRAR